MTPEQREQFARMRAQGGGGFGGQRAGGQRPGGRGNFGAQGAETAVAGGPRPAQRRTGMVMVQKADGTLEARRIAYGVTNRVHSEVIEGLTEGEVVVIGRKENEAAAAARSALPNQNFQQNNRGNQAFPAGGGGFQGGGGGGGRGF